MIGNAGHSADRRAPSPQRAADVAVEAAMPKVAQREVSEPRAGVKPSVAPYLGEAEALETHLRDALVLVAERHERNYEIAQGATTIATWCAEHLVWIAPLSKRYGRDANPRPGLLRSALLGGTRIGAVGELADVTDLAVLVQKAQLTWLILMQGARELHDAELLEVASRAHDHARRQLAWLTTVVEHEAPDAVSVVPDRRGQLTLSLPKRATSIAAIPDLIWGPMVAAALLLVVGVLGLVAGSPWLVPSLGPTAVLIAVMPLHPTSRAWNTFGGHVGGLAAGFVAVSLLGAAGAPSVLGDHVLVPVRVGAAVVAIALTMVIGSVARASHPPAAATTLLVALGGIATLEQAIPVVAGVAAITIAGEAFRQARSRRVTPSERFAPPDSVAARLIHRS